MRKPAFAFLCNEGAPVPPGWLASNLRATALGCGETAIYTLLRNGVTRESFRSQVPTLAATIAVAELFLNALPVRSSTMWSESG